MKLIWFINCKGKSFYETQHCPFLPISFFLQKKEKIFATWGNIVYLCSMNIEKKHIVALRQSIEEALGRQLLTAKDFDILSERIYARVGEMVSRNTLKRIYGKMDEERDPRISTLSILARFIGYTDFYAFVNDSARSEEEGESSSPFMGRRLSVIDGLSRGDQLRLTWHPRRVCDVEYNGSLHFRVIHSENTRLKEGDTFLCGIIIEDQPLYLDMLKQGNKPPTAYICGRQGGLRFELLNR